MKITFPRKTNEKLYNTYKRYSFDEPKKEVNFPLCIDKNGKVNFGTVYKVGDTDTVPSIPYDEKCCKNSERLGDIHTHPLLEDSDDWDYFEESQYFSQSDFFGMLSNHLNNDITDNVSCAMEPISLKRDREEYLIVCKRLKNVTEDDLREVKRDRHPNWNRINMSKKVTDPIVKQALVKLSKEMLEDYPYGGMLPESVIVGMRDEVVEEVKQQTGQNVEGGVVYPIPEMQHTTNTQEWLHILLRANWTPDRVRYERERNRIWRKADAASIEKHLKELGKVSSASFPLVCRRFPLRKTRKGQPERDMICNFGDKTLNL